MFNNNNNGFAPRKMVEGNWKCSECGKEITQLPFEPTPGAPVSCKDCWIKNRPTRPDMQNRAMVQGNWKCSDCGTEITQLPFEPSADRPIYCKNCWSKNRPPKRY